MYLAKGGGLSISSTVEFHYYMKLFVTQSRAEIMRNKTKLTLVLCMYTCFMRIKHFNFALLTRIILAVINTSKYTECQT